MPAFLVDEDLPRSLTRRLRAAGFAVEDVRDIGLRGQPDDAILAHAVARGLVLVTGDAGFGNLIRFPLGSHPGIVIARFPNEVPAGALSEALVRALQGLSDPDLAGSLAIVEPGRIRLRRPR